MRTQRQLGISDVRSLLHSPTKTRDEIIRTVLFHACAFWNMVGKNPDDHSDCILLQIGLPISGTLSQPVESSSSWGTDPVGKIITEDDVLRHLKSTF